MNEQELIKQWDEYIESMGSVMGAVEHMAQQMRDRIEELVKERDDLGRKLNTARYGQPDFAWSIHEEEMADLRAKLTKAVEERKAMAMRDAGYDVYAGLEAKLAKAVEALVQLERIVGDILGAHLQDSESRDKAIDLIKTTLAELEGK